eukprot:4684032-Prymnesium_polylepis.1
MLRAAVLATLFALSAAFLVRGPSVRTVQASRFAQPTRVLGPACVEQVTMADHLYDPASRDSHYSGNVACAAALELNRRNGDFLSD